MNSDKNFKCTECPSSFDYKDSLKKHLKTVHKIDFFCNQCCEHFTSKTLLETHYKDQHLKKGQKMFPCDRCDKILTRQTLLKKHIQVVHEKLAEKFECDTCKKQFATSKGHQNHIPVCGVEFNDTGR